MKRKTSYCRYQQKSLSAATAALLIHLISFLKKVQVHFGQDKYDFTNRGYFYTEDYELFFDK